ncbi:hypothetical protein V5O48_001171 [Marasmius crinis-equi]|uniref:C2H2-type domain-containing protein n=1 Tax=Marasmius crinis-equi TaxID=585013 RepID=A0ABR3FZ84_9AGAR
MASTVFCNFSTNSWLTEDFYESDFQSPGMLAQVPKTFICQDIIADFRPRAYSCWRDSLDYIDLDALHSTSCPSTSGVDSIPGMTLKDDVLQVETLQDSIDFEDGPAASNNTDGTEQPATSDFFDSNFCYSAMSHTPTSDSLLTESSPEIQLSPPTPSPPVLEHVGTPAARPSAEPFPSGSSEHETSLLDIALLDSLLNDENDSLNFESDESHSVDVELHSSRSSSPSSFVTDLFSDVEGTRSSSPAITDVDSSDSLSSLGDDCSSEAMDMDTLDHAASDDDTTAHDPPPSDSQPCITATTSKIERHKGASRSTRRKAKVTRKAAVRRVPCSLCRQTFTREADRDRHLASVHKDSSGAPEFLGSHQCRFCGKDFSRPDAKARHEGTRSVYCQKMARQRRG